MFFVEISVYICAHVHVYLNFQLYEKWTDTLALIYIYNSILFHYIQYISYVLYALAVCNNSYVAMQ